MDTALEARYSCPVAKRSLILLVVGVLGYVAAAGVPSVGATAPSAPGHASWFTLRGKVTRVVDGDTLHVKLGARTEKVRLIGVDAPEAGRCYANEATRMLRALTLNRKVVLTGDRTQTRRDTFKRLLAYVGLPAGGDVGRTLLARGFAEVYVTRRPFARQRAYEAAAESAIDARAGLNGACAPAPAAPVPVAPLPPPPPTTTTSSNCAASYPDVCIPPPPPDLDCGDVSHRRFRVVHTVPSPDPHRFDGDRDGIGCES